MANPKGNTGSLIGGDPYGSMKQSALDRFHGTASAAKGFLTPRPAGWPVKDSDHGVAQSDQGAYTSTMSSANSKLTTDMNSAHDVQTWGGKHDPNFGEYETPNY
jgi:hypothetical protein